MSLRFNNICVYMYYTNGPKNWRGQNWYVLINSCIWTTQAIFSTDLWCSAYFFDTHWFLSFWILPHVRKILRMGNVNFLNWVYQTFWAYVYCNCIVYNYNIHRPKMYTYYFQFMTPILANFIGFCGICRDEFRLTKKR